MLKLPTRKKKIPCYVLIFDQVEIIKRSLDFLAKYADRLEIIVIENPSASTPKIKKIVETHGKAKKIKRYYLFESNITNNAFDVIIENESNTIKKSPYVIVTDGDLVCDNKNWLNEIVGVLKNHNDIFACGISLDKVNLPLKSFPDAASWIPEDVDEYDDYIEARTGAHLLCMRGAELDDFMKWKKGKKIYFRDGELYRFGKNVLGKRWARSKNALAYHLTWDLYKDKNNAYTKLKSNKSFTETWSHDEVAKFSLEEY